MAIIHQSDFTGTDGVDADTLTPTTGGGLTRMFGGKRLLVHSNRVYSPDSFAHYSCPNIPAAYPYSISARVRQISSGLDDGFGIVADGTSNDVAWTLRDGYVGLYIGGSLYDRYFFAFSAGTEVDIELIVNSATSVTAKSHGTARFTNVSVSTLGTIDKAQIRHEPTGGSTTTGKHMDWFIVDDLASAIPIAAISSGYHVRGLR